MSVIKIENLSKSYQIGHQKADRYETLRDVMAHKMRGITQRIRHPLAPNKETIQLEEFWALKDVNLEIQQGERVGIIDLLLVGDIDQYHLNDLSRKAEQYIQRKIRHLVLTPSEFVAFKPDLIHRPNLLIWAADKE